SSDSSEFTNNHEMYKGDGYNVNDNRNLISSFLTKSKRLVFDSRTSDDESSDNLRPHSSIDKNNAPIPASILLDYRKPKRKIFPHR
ncbi:hypothetical protein AVEN_191599-1, partial [Araneus ventricosus]